MGPLIPPFWTSCEVSSWFRSQSGQIYSHLLEPYEWHISRDSFLVWHLPTSWLASMAAEPSLHIPVRHCRDWKPGAIRLPLTVWDQPDVLLTNIWNYLLWGRLYSTMWVTETLSCWWKSILIIWFDCLMIRSQL